MKSVDEMMGVSSAAGMGAAPPGVDPTSPEAKKFAEPGVPAKKKRRVVITDPRAPLKRSTFMKFREWAEDQK